MRAEPILVIGAGAIGSIVGVHLLQAGHAVDFVETNDAHLGAIRRAGLRVSGALDATVHPKIMRPGDVDGQYGRILLAVKSRHTQDALPVVKAALSADGYVVSLQNGLEEYAIAEAVGASRTIGAYLTFGGYFVEQGHVKYGGSGSFKIGEIDGAMSARLRALAQTLSVQQPVEATDNIFGYLWAKMALGAVYFGTAITDLDVVDVYESARSRAVLAALCGEVVAVADKLGVRVETTDGFDPKVFRAGGGDPVAMEASWAAQRRYWGAHDNARTGVWRDLAIHKRPTEIDGQIGAVVRLAREAGVSVPLLYKLCDVVQSIERGERGLSLAALDAIAAA